MRILTTLLGAVAMLFLASAGAMAQSKDKPSLNICTGSQTGNYYFAGSEIGKRLQDDFKVTLYTTKGSMENIERMMGGQCDVAFVQNDALRVFKQKNPQVTMKIDRTMELYNEYAHLACNRDAKIDKITKLTNKHIVAVGPLGGGASVTWEGFILADKKRYEPVQTDTKTGMQALSKVAAGDELHCFFWMGGLNAPLFLNDAQKFADKIVLVPTDDSDVLDAKDEKGKTIYRKESIPGGTYKKIQDGTFSSSVNSIAVPAMLITRQDWIDANDNGIDKLIRAATSARSTILARVEGK